VRSKQQKSPEIDLRFFAAFLVLLERNRIKYDAIASLKIHVMRVKIST
jgi:hypothetical protein